MSASSKPERAALPNAKRIVVKVGTRVLCEANGRPNHSRISSIVDEVSKQLSEGREVVLVSSGAIGAGMEALGLKRRPRAVADLQMAAAVGQSRLMAVYDHYFSKRGALIGQVLFTHDDLRNRARHLNARNTMLNLLRRKIVPVVNENDVVSNEEIKFGDNDALAAQVALLVQADALLLLTTTNGLRAGTEKGAGRIPYLPEVSKEALSFAVGKGSELSVGGMASKLVSAQLAVDGGVAVVIADGRKPSAVDRVLRGEDLGTLIGGPSRSDYRLSGRKKWIAYFQRPSGSLVINEGAAQSILERGKSLLPIGVVQIQGQFGMGACLSIKRQGDGIELARGLSEYSSTELVTIIGKKTSEVQLLLGPHIPEEVVHRDNLVLMKR